MTCRQMNRSQLNLSFCACYTSNGIDKYHDDAVNFPGLVSMTVTVDRVILSDSIVYLDEEFLLLIIIVP